MDSFSEFWRQETQVSCPSMVTSGTCQGHDGETLCEEPTTIVIALGAPNGQQIIRVWHSSLQARGLVKLQGQTRRSGRFKKSVARTRS